MAAQRPSGPRQRRAARLPETVLSSTLADGWAHVAQTLLIFSSSCLFPRIMLYQARPSATPTPEAMAISRMATAGGTGDRRGQKGAPQPPKKMAQGRRDDTHLDRATSRRTLPCGLPLYKDVLFGEGVFHYQRPPLETVPWPTFCASCELFSMSQKADIARIIAGKKTALVLVDIQVGLDLLNFVAVVPFSPPSWS